MQLLNHVKITQQLTPEAKRYFCPIQIFSTLESTNTYLLTQQTAPGSVCLAEQQTAGRGRQGRVWVSPYARNIYLSTLCAVPSTPAIGGLSLVVGLAVIEALQAAGIFGLQLKWPNDIVYKQHKLAGILLEAAQYTAETVRVVVGIGINVAMPGEVHIDQPWIDLKTLIQPCPDRNVLVGYLLNALQVNIQTFNTQQLARVFAQWPVLDSLYNQPVQFQQGCQLQQGIARGIDVQGRLLIESQGNTQPISSGEVKHLRAAF